MKTVLLFLILTNNKLHLLSCVFLNLDNLVKQICFLIYCDKWLSFVSSLLHPGLLAFGTSLGAVHSLCCGSTQRNVTVGCSAFTWPSVNACSESSSGGCTLSAQQGSLATRSVVKFWGSYLKRPFVRQH